MTIGRDGMVYLTSAGHDNGYILRVTRDFYALDRHRDRLLQINADGKVVQAHALPHFDKCPAQGFRVCECSF